MTRARDLGIRIGFGRPGELNAITDVPGVKVGHTTLISGDGPLVIGSGPVRTGVTVVIPHEGDVFGEPLFGGSFTLNGCGQVTGLEWIRESGLLGGVIGLTNTHSVGTVHDALIAAAVAGGRTDSWSLPVVGETWDGLLNDVSGFHVRAEHVQAALAVATDGPVAEGNVGGGTGMICHEFKGGIGTASRVLPPEVGGWTVGALVQANYGDRDQLRVDGVAVGEALPVTEISSPYGIDRSPLAWADAGSIIGLVATNAPLVGQQCTRLATRAALGAARVGCYASNGSGDMFLAFATGNRGLSRTAGEGRSGPQTVATTTVADSWITPLLLAAVEATEEAIINALVAAETMSGADGVTAHRLPHDRLVDLVERAGRLNR